MEDRNKKEEKSFRVYHGDTPSDVLNRVQRVLATYGLRIKEVGKEDFYVEHEIEVMK